MKIIVIIPTLNEEENIRFITKTINNGLKKVRGEIEAVIINADSESIDRTREYFLNTKTDFPKKSILCNKNIGKGRNIYEVLKQFIKDTDLFIMIDADVISAKSEWVMKLLQPLINRQAELTVPVYKRNRFEGNTTNHFSSPLIYACFGKYISQPIAGDFAFTGKLAKKIYKSFTCESDYGYGIDTLITWTALLNNFKVKQVKLGRKIHKPSFPKIVPMFRQVSLTTFNLLCKNREKIRKNAVRFKGKKLSGLKVIDDKYVKFPTRKQITSVKEEIKKMSKKYKTFENLNSELWTDILADFVIKVLKRKWRYEKLDQFSRSTTVSYLLRVLGYFDETKNMSTNEIGRLIITQAEMLRQKIINISEVEVKYHHV
jgi:glycosyltransferase involved in cell wall biosynthesis